MWKVFVPLKKSPYLLTLKYPGINPQNQSFVTIIDGDNFN